MDLMDSSWVEDGMGRTLTMMRRLHAGVCCVLAMGLLFGLMGVAAGAQGVTTTNEVRAMRGLGPVEGAGIRGQRTKTGDLGTKGAGVKSEVEETGALVG
jgi:hypothetical protein